MAVITRVYLDTNVYADAARGEDPPGRAASLARALLAMIHARRLKLVTSVLVRREVMSAPEPALRRRLLACIPGDSETEERVHTSSADFRRARQFMARVPGLGRNDALHIALAIKAKADVLVTQDRRNLLSSIRNAHKALGEPAFRALFGQLRFVDLLEWWNEVEHG